MKTKMGIPKAQHSRGDTPQGGNSHGIESSTDAYFRQAKAESAFATMPGCANTGALSDYHQLGERTWGYETADVLGIHNTTVYQVAKRFRQRGEWGLLDGREDNGVSKLDESYLSRLYEVVRARPPRFGWRRPTWTREMLVETMRRETGVRIHVATMSRALVQARRGRPRPTVRCPWAPAWKLGV